MQPRGSAGLTWGHARRRPLRRPRGIRALEITVEVHAAHGLPQTTLVGLGAGAVKEARERVAAALASSGLAPPPRRTIISLAPADLPKTGSAFDLPIALGVLAATGLIDPAVLAPLAVVGELALDGALRPCAAPCRSPRGPPTPATRSSSRPATSPRRRGWGARPSSRRPRWASWSTRSLEGRCARRRARSCARGRGARRGRRLRRRRRPGRREARARDRRGRRPPRRADRPAGAGKTMLARRLPSVLPPLDDAEALEVLAIRSVAGLPAVDAPARPFRAPHHTVSTAGLVGGGSPPRPGEVSLAHHGVLFLDEMLEFPRHVLDALRQPLEDGHVTIARAVATLAYPARFTLVGAMNPCPCGRAGEPDAHCTCTPADVERYLARLSGPLADRIDMHIRVGAVPPRAIGARTAGEGSAPCAPGSPPRASASTRATPRSRT
jgi:magnesium chelatase family protein